MKYKNLKSAVITTAIMLAAVGLAIGGFFLWSGLKTRHENSLINKHVWVYENGQYAVESPGNIISPEAIRSVIKDFELKAGTDEQTGASRLTLYVHADPKARMYMLKRVIYKNMNEIPGEGSLGLDTQRIYLQKAGTNDRVLVWNREKRSENKVVDLGDIYLKLEAFDSSGRPCPFRTKNESIGAYIKRNGPWTIKPRILGDVFEKADGRPDFSALSQYLSIQKNEYEPPAADVECTLDIYISARDPVCLSDVFRVLWIARDIGIKKCTFKEPEIPY